MLAFQWHFKHKSIFRNFWHETQKTHTFLTYFFWIFFLNDFFKFYLFILNKLRFWTLLCHHTSTFVFKSYCFTILVLTFLFLLRQLLSWIFMAVFFSSFTKFSLPADAFISNKTSLHNNVQGLKPRIYVLKLKFASLKPQGYIVIIESFGAKRNRKNNGINDTKNKHFNFKKIADLRCGNMKHKDFGCYFQSWGGWFDFRCLTLGDYCDCFFAPRLAVMSQL